jgi:uncharacterized membrane protein YdjX (TVP38/TMEM64 family)
VLLFLCLVTRALPADAVHCFMGGAGPLGPIVLTVAILATYILAPLSSSPLLIAGYYGFGRDVVWCVVTAAWLAAVVNFWIARRLGRAAVVRIVGETNMRRVDAVTGRYGLWMLFVLRISQGGVHDFVSYAAGLTSMRFRPYLAVTTLGMAPGTIAWYALASWVDDPLAFTALTLGLGFVLSGAFLVGAAAKWSGRAPLLLACRIVLRGSPRAGDNDGHRNHR